MFGFLPVKLTLKPSNALSKVSVAGYYNHTMVFTIYEEDLNLPKFMNEKKNNGLKFIKKDRKIIQIIWSFIFKIMVNMNDVNIQAKNRVYDSEVL